MNSNEWVLISGIHRSIDILHYQFCNEATWFFSIRQLACFVKCLSDSIFHELPNDLEHLKKYIESAYATTFGRSVELKHYHLLIFFSAVDTYLKNYDEQFREEYLNKIGIRLSDFNL